MFYLSKFLLVKMAHVTRTTKGMVPHRVERTWEKELLLICISNRVHSLERAASQEHLLSGKEEVMPYPKALCHAHLEKNFHPQNSPVLARVIKNPRETLFLDKELVKGALVSQRICGGESWRRGCTRSDYPNPVTESSHISGLSLSYTCTW